MADLFYVSQAALALLDTTVVDSMTRIKQGIWDAKVQTSHDWK